MQSLGPAETLVHSRKHYEVWLLSTHLIPKVLEIKAKSQRSSQLPSAPRVCQPFQVWSKRKLYSSSWRSCFSLKLFALQHLKNSKSERMAFCHPSNIHLNVSVWFFLFVCLSHISFTLLSKASGRSALSRKAFHSLLAISHGVESSRNNV